jgi:hypothetical protein
MHKNMQKIRAAKFPLCLTGKTLFKYYPLAFNLHFYKQTFTRQQADPGSHRAAD